MKILLKYEMENSLKKLKEKIDLNFDETKEIFMKIMSNKVSEKEMHEFLILLSNRVRHQVKLPLVSMY